MVKKYIVVKKGIVGIFPAIVIAGILFIVALPSFVLTCVILVITGVVIMVQLRKEFTYSMTRDINKM